MTEALHCPGVESVDWKGVPIQGQGTVEVQLRDEAGQRRAFCPVYQFGVCEREVVLWPNITRTASSYCALSSYQRSLYPELIETALIAEPDREKLSAITEVLNISKLPNLRPQEEVRENIVEDVFVAQVTEPSPVVRAEPEKAPAKLKPEVIEIGEDESFSPFLEATEFTVPEEEISKAYKDEATDEDLPVLLKRDINLSGVKGVVEIVPDLPQDGDPSEYYSDSEMPLGPVRWVGESKDGETSYYLLPVRVRVKFETRSFKQYLILQKHLLEVSVGNNSYFLSCSKDPEEIEYEKEDFKNLGKGEKMTFSDSLPTDSDGDEINIALPMDIEKLRLINMRFIENPEYEENTE